MLEFEISRYSKNFCEEARMEIHLQNNDKSPNITLELGKEGVDARFWLPSLPRPGPLLDQLYHDQDLSS